MPKVTCIEDLRILASRRMPRMFYDYVDSGSWTESTYRANASDFELLKFKQRVAVNIESRRLESAMVGRPVSIPVGLAPTGLTGMVHADGEILAARAAEAANIPFTLSTMSICSMEDVARHTKAPFWFQLYFMRDRAFVQQLIERAEAAGCSAVMLTLDLQIAGQRHKDIRNGLSTPPKPTLMNLLNLMTKPSWCKDMLGTPRRSFGNIIGHAKGVSDMSSLSSWSAEQFDPRLSWSDIEWVRKLWKGKLILKGILCPEDASAASQTGADAIVVSNHGGRQLDGAPSTIRVLSSVVEAVQQRTEVWLDGGISSGQDVLKAIGLGADATLIGRSFLWGLGALGQQGVAMAIDLIQRELDKTMAFCGYTDVREVDAGIFYRDDLLWTSLDEARSRTLRLTA
ncbi:alpha-hydroxy acid oxidase [Caballeronia novacaledonica]|uniref:Alpha-hydroxy-acid oxidizing protein n=1 Tax=Caballeronia novacaledonica TaxID=1544861 RepID=A0AA37MUM6_9BURK|nr:alpha-hydroxy acid oxidase [Caballeronia novacaledonica]GJH29354.1 alpha-hydroxy-acid oxidizing protein [Caballeronia novacaledonica]